MAENKPVNITHKGVHTFEKEKDDATGRAKVLWIVEWIIDGGAKSYKNLEKREFFKDKGTGEWKLGKSKGLNLHDWLILTKPENIKLTARLLGSQLPEHADTPPKTDAPGDAQAPGDAAGESGSDF